MKDSFPLMSRRPSTSLMFRVALFCLYSWTALLCVDDDLWELATYSWPTTRAAILYLTEKPIGMAYLVPAAREEISALFVRRHRY